MFDGSHIAETFFGACGSRVAWHLTNRASEQVNASTIYPVRAEMILLGQAEDRMCLFIAFCQAKDLMKRSFGHPPTMQGPFPAGPCPQWQMHVYILTSSATRIAKSQKCVVIQ